MDKQNSILPSVLETIGMTPLVELKRLTEHSGVPKGGQILAKLEYLNPGFSKKDRIAKQLIEDAEASGELSPGQTIVELTSGNTGTGLAIVCAVKGYPFIAVMSKGNSEERRRMMSSLGAEVILVDQLQDSIPGQVSGGDLEQVELRTQQIVEQRNAFRADQFRLDGNFRAHFLHTGQEIIEQTQGGFDAFCDFVGSGGTFAGCAAAFKQHNSQIQCFIVEPKNAAILSEGISSEPRHRIQGGGYSKTELKSLNKKTYRWLFKSLR